MPDNAADLDPNLLDRVANSLSEQGWIELPGFIAPSLVASLRGDATSKFSSGEFREARIGRGSDLKMEKRIRSDEISWFDPAALSGPQTRFWHILEGVRRGLNERLYLGLTDFEAHYARYAPGASYGKHVDRFSTDDARTVSAVLYLNDNWSAADGGELALYAPTAAGNFDSQKRSSSDNRTEQSTLADMHPMLISPLGGTLVCFMSADVEHEVLPSKTRPRQSIAIWFRKQKSPFR